MNETVIMLIVLGMLVLFVWLGFFANWTDKESKKL
jgi:hypothetical protein